MGSRNQHNWHRRAALLLVLAVGLTTLIVSGVALAASGAAGKTKTNTRHGPVVMPGTTTLAGQLQHAPANLDELGRTSGSSVVSGSLSRSLAAAAAVSLAPELTEFPSNPTYETGATFAFSSPEATSFQCRLDGNNRSWAACSSPKAYPGPLSFGSHTFRVRGIDSSGPGPERAYTWTISPPPAPMIDQAPDRTTLERSATFTFSNVLAGVTFQCRLDNEAYAACTSPKSYSSLRVGNHTFRVRARNASGAGPEVVYSWTITNLPAPTITSSPTNPTLDKSATFNFTHPVAGVTFQCRLDSGSNSYTACASPTAYAGPLGFGPHTFHVRAVSSTLGTSADAVYTWTVALTPPVISSGPAETTTETSASFTYSDTEPGVTYECRLDGAAFAPCTSPTAYGSLALGQHTFDVRALKSGATSATVSWSWAVVVEPPKPLKMRLLVVSADGNETDFPALKAFLDQIGVPYTTMVATQTPDLTREMLVDGGAGRYQGVILTTGNLTYSPDGGANWISAFTAEEWQTLWAYEAEFKVRQVTSYTFPYGFPEDYGLNLETFQDTLASPLQATLTDAGKDVFPFLNTSSPVTFKGAWAYLATKRDASVTPLITTNAGHVLASINSYPDGRENLAVTVANNPNLVHSQLLSYGLVNWVTRGVFLGERHVNLTVQVDDLLLDSDMWDIENNVVDEDPTHPNRPRYRLDGADWSNIIAWQNGQRVRPNFSQLRLEFAFNGEGADPETWQGDPLVPTDTLTPAVQSADAGFSYVNHTYSHEGLDLTDYNTARSEIERNQQAAAALGLDNYVPDAFVQPDISGLTNPSFLQAAFDTGIRYLIGDTSRPEWNNPTWNTGFWATGQPSILIVPRRANNLFYSLRTREEWVDEYNWFYWKGSPSSSPWKFWDDPQTFEQILDHESDNLLSYMLRWDLDPWMFHQANLGRYSSQQTLLGDLLEATFDKYDAVYNLPVRNLTQKQAGQEMAERMAYNASGADATLRRCVDLTLTVDQSANVPVTGVANGSVENYGGQSISTVPVTAGTPKTIPISC
jgi:peptidoglycan/xylan/chitin deacetylase (PgdA/CDA1 family)